MRSLIAPLILVATSVTAEDAAFLCEGFAPDWRVEGTAAVDFDWEGRVALDVMHTALGENDPDVRAYTFVGLRDTAILITKAQACDIRGTTWDYAATVLTQRGQTPVVLSGCCKHRPE